MSTNQENLNDNAPGDATQSRHRRRYAVRKPGSPTVPRRLDAPPTSVVAYEGSDIYDRRADPGAIRPVRLLTLDDAANRPPAQWLVPGFLMKGALAVLTGAPGVGKSFIAIDLALHLAAGLPWGPKDDYPDWDHHPEPRLQHHVLYIAGEASDPFMQRLNAWRHKHQVASNIPFRLVPDPVPFLDPHAVDHLRDTLKAEFPNPDLIVIDTLARNFGDGDENLARDMSRFVASLTRLGAATGAAILILHHTPESKDKPRGSNALPGAGDTSMLAKHHKGKVVAISCLKQRDATPFAEIAFKLESVPLGQSAKKKGGQSTTLVPRFLPDWKSKDHPHSENDDSEQSGTTASEPQHWRLTLETLVSLGGFARNTYWREATAVSAEGRKGFSESAHNLRVTGEGGLVDAGYVEKIENPAHEAGCVGDGKGACFRITEKGRAFLEPDRRS
jgi:hypothetical protein